MDADPTLPAFAREVSRPDPEIDLARSALLIAGSHYVGLEPDRYLRRLDRLAHEARAGGDSLGQLHRLREYLFEEQGFSGNTEEYQDPRNSYLNDVLDRRLGIPITLSLVLIEVGRRLGLEMEGVGLPGHFITKARVGGEHLLLDPFNGGTILTGEACTDVVQRAVGQAVELTPAHFAPVTNRQFLTRMLANLKGAYWGRGAWAKVVAIIDRLLVLNPSAGTEWRDRGIAWSNLGDIGRGLADWERYLTEFPGAPDHEQVKSQFRRTRQKLAQLN